MDAFAREQRFLMNAADRKGRELDALLTDRAWGRALELGTYLGYTALRLGERCAEVHTVETDRSHADAAERVLAHAGLSGRVRVHRGALGQVIGALPGAFELVFIDHAKDAYLPDLVLLEDAGMLAEGAVVIADNTGLFAEDLAGYLARVRGPGWSSRTVTAHMEYRPDLHDEMEISVRLPSARR